MNLLPAHTAATLLARRFRIRHGTESDLTRCQQIARQFRAALPFVSLPSLRTAARKGELFVAECDGQTVGFVHWHARRDGVSTVYDLAVDTRYQALGIGRALLYAVPAPIQLKCKADNARANRFYANAGMAQTGTATARNGTPLVVWRLNVLAELVQGNNANMPAVARQSGMAYGTRHIETPQDWPFAVDIHWRDYTWADYLRKLTRWQPVQALAPDYEHPDQLRRLLCQIDDLRALGILRILVCPKFAGAVQDIPPDCIVAVSIPSSYAGFVPDFAELNGRRVHLLGGSPVDWFGQSGKRNDKSATGYLAAMRGAGANVISLDGNIHTKIAESGGFWQDSRWQFDSQAFDLYTLCALSGRNIARQLNAVAGYAQRGVWAA